MTSAVAELGQEVHREQEEHGSYLLGDGSLITSTYDKVALLPKEISL